MSDFTIVAEIDTGELQADLVRVTKISPTRVYRKFWRRHFQEKLKRRYAFAAQETPYAESTIGRVKPVSRAVSGGGDDPGFGIDSGALYRDLTGQTGNVLFTERELGLFSDLPYASYIEGLFSEKGPFSPDGVLGYDEEDLKILEGLLVDEAIEVVTK